MIGAVQTEMDVAACFPEGATVVRRDVLHGKVWSAAPHRVLADSGDELRLGYWPGIESLAPSTWIDWLGTGDEATRKRAIPDVARGRWRLDRWVWRDTSVLAWFGVDPDFSIPRFCDAGGGAPLRWYVNFERPYRRTAIGIDTFDLFVDLVIAPDLGRWWWKDEDEYAQARRLGLIDDVEHRRVERARERAVALVEAHGGPFGQDWPTWAAGTDWALPVLPATALEVR
jgi:hypothetical protein